MRKIPVPDGAKLYVTATLPAAEGTGTATNAANAVVTIQDHSVDAGSLVLVDSEDWPELAGLVTRASVAADTITLQGIDTTNTEKFPAGGKVSVTVLPADAGYTRLPFVKEIGVSGGDLKTSTSEYLDMPDAEFSSGRSPRRLEYDVSFNADGASRSALKAANEKLTVHKLVYKGGDATYYVGELHYDDAATTQKGNEMTTKSVVLLSNAPSFVKKAA